MLTAGGGLTALGLTTALGFTTELGFTASAAGDGEGSAEMRSIRVAPAAGSWPDAIETGMTV